MKKIQRLYSKINDNRGVTATIVVILMTVFLGFTALVIDLGYAYITKNELQNIADASALAATRQLGEIYLNLTNSGQQNYVCSGEDATLIKKAAQDVALANIAAGKKIEILSEDIKIGKWDPPFKETNEQPHAVKVTARRDQISNSSITTFFANILGQSTIGLTADATAALSGQSTIEEGELIPIGISSEWFNQNLCGQPIRFHPSNDPDSCGGWHAYFNDKGTNTSSMTQMVNSWKNNVFTPPGASIGDLLYFTGGNLGNQLYEAFDSLFQKMREIDGDGDPLTWTASVAVYDPSTLSDPCGNPNKGLPIEGFAKVIISEIIYPKDKDKDKDKNKNNKEIIADVECNLYAPGRGGGNDDFKTFGSIPGLVE
jgi:Flp pilus assembly protein TadG